MLFAFALSWGNSFLAADEIVVSNAKPQAVLVGDFSLSYPGGSGFDQIPFVTQPETGAKSGVNFTIRAGDLWTFYKSQGIESVDRLTLLVDLKKTEACCDLAMDSVSLTILDGSRPIKKAVLGSDNRLVIKNAEVLQFKPEAQLELGLGFDFMQQFTAESDEIIIINSNLEGADLSGTEIAIQGARRYFSFPSFLPLAGFLGFWGLMFLALRRTTMPNRSGGTPLLPEKQRVA